MATLRDLIVREQLAKRGAAFELDLEPGHLASTLPPELRVFEKNFKFVPVEHDPFPKPEPKAAKAKKKGSA